MVLDPSGVGAWPVVVIGWQSWALDEFVISVHCLALLHFFCFEGTVELD